MQVGFAGLGAIGTPMATRLAAVHDLAVWNRTATKATAFTAEHRDVAVAATPRELAEASEVVVTCLPTSAEVAALLDGPDGMLAGFRPGGLLIDCTSGDPATSRHISERLAAAGVAFIDAPVSGGPPLAATGQLTVMWGGDEVLADRLATALAPIAARFVHLGPVGSGHAMKAINNALLAVNILTAAEGLVALARLGIDPRAAVEVLNASSGRSFVTESLVPERVLTGKWPALFRLALLEKDVGIACEVTADAGTSSPILDRAGELYAALRAELFDQGQHDRHHQHRASEIAQRV